ncbi:hypothetical protein C2U70_25460 [Bradyrhizobium guangdongense]|uniref:hypothetical protein n=1 Tax=Bradyrhizobium guangdongense TaxID=1325090 RepID=UPI0011299377|nr:hypothetical protein [Bradyrhizobium guangdongense]TPQ30881.1 hypothetical protein C2U70_25460 [Bradyrhizobium guangdongense]
MGRGVGRRRSRVPQREGGYEVVSKRAAIGAAYWLHLAAAPTFAIMAMLTAVIGGGSMDALCSAAGASPLGGMVPMYLLMTAFHAAPWLKLIGSHARTSRKDWT